MELDAGSFSCWGCLHWESPFPALAWPGRNRQFPQTTQLRAGVYILNDQTILADRRLQGDSLTGGPFKIGTTKRSEDVAETLRCARTMEADPTEDTARQLGALDRARTLDCLE